MSDEQNSEAQSNVEDAQKHAQGAAGAFGEAADHVRQAAGDLRSAAEAKAKELREAAEAKAREFRERASATAGEFRQRAEEYYGAASERARTWQEESETYIRQNPLKAVCTALFAGFVVGLLIRKH